MDRAFVERPRQTRIIESYAAAEERGPAQAQEVGLPLFVDDHPQIDRGEFQPVEDDFTAQAERKRVADSKGGSGAVDCGDELAGLQVEEFYVTKRDSARAELWFDLFDLGAQPVGFERLFDLDREKAIELFRAEVKERDQDGERYQTKRRIHKQSPPRGPARTRGQIFRPGAHP